MILFTLRPTKDHKVGLPVAIRPQDIQEITEHKDSQYSWVTYTRFNSPQAMVVVGKVSNLVEEVNTHINNTHVGESI